MGARKKLVGRRRRRASRGAELRGGRLTARQVWQPFRAPAIIDRGEVFRVGGTPHFMEVWGENR
jgi:hypothetical protein